MSLSLKASNAASAAASGGAAAGGQQAKPKAPSRQAAVPAPAAAPQSNVFGVDYSQTADPTIGPPTEQQAYDPLAVANSTAGQTENAMNQGQAGLPLDANAPQQGNGFMSALGGLFK